VYWEEARGRDRRLIAWQDEVAGGGRKGRGEGQAQTAAAQAAAVQGRAHEGGGAA
jgi:hypothetical protein